MTNICLIGIFVIKKTKKRALQSVLLPQEVRMALRHYMEAAGTAECDSSSPFWVNSKGVPLFRGALGVCLKKWMMDNLELNFGSTNFRSLHDTAAANAYRAGIIDRHERDALICANGHSLDTSKLYYQRLDATADSISAHEAYVKLHGGAPPEISSQQAAVQLPSFGEHHSNQNPNCQRVRWDEEEIAILEAITTRLKVHSPKQLMKLALEEIQGNEEFRKVFHKRHVATTGRLSAGYKQHLLIKPC